MKTSRIFLLAAVAFFPACTGYYKGKPLMTGEEVDVVSAGIAQTQFSDLPVPASFELQTRDLESFGTQVGTFRLGHLIYHGEESPAATLDYLSARLPEHGWKIASMETALNGAIRAIFQKGPQTASFSISREEIANRQSTQGNSSVFTKLLIDIKTGKGG